MADKVVCVRNVILPLAYPRLHSHCGMLKTQHQRQLHRPHLNIQSTSNNYGGKNTATRKHLVLSKPPQWHMVVVPPMAPSKYQLSVLLWHWPPCADIIFSVVTTIELSPPRWLATTEPTPPPRCLAVFSAVFLGAVSLKLPLSIPQIL